MYQSSVLHRWCLAVLAGASISGCQPEERLASIHPPIEPPPSVKPYAFMVTVDVANGTVSVAPPTRDSARSDRMTANSLTGGEIIGMTATNVVRSAIGQYVANKRTISFDLSISNRLSTADLVTPTFPILPAGISGILAFPYTVAVGGTQGGKATADTSWNGNGTTGSGAPINFFNDFDDCVTGANADCSRWVMFPSPLTPGSSTPARHVGFVVDKNVTTVTAYIVVAADLADHPPVIPPGLGALLGRVFTPDDPATGATVTVNPGGRTTTIDGNGRYQFDGLAAGSYSVTLSNLPAGCPIPAPLTAVVTVGGATSLQQNLACTPPTGALTGTISSPQRGALGGYTIFLGQGNEAGLERTTDANGGFTFPDLEPGVYFVGVEGLSGCTTNTSPDYTVTAGNTTTVSVEFSCSGGSGTGTIVGTVTLARAIGVYLPVHVAPTTGPQLLAITSPQDQTYRSTDVPAGQAVVSLPSVPASCSGGQPQTVTVTPGGTVTVSFTLDCPLTYFGRVTSSNLSASGLVGLPGVTVYLNGYHGYYGTTDADGFFGIDGFPVSDRETGIGFLITDGLPAGCLPPVPRNQLPYADGIPHTPFEFDADVNCPTGGNGTTGSVR